MIRWTWGPYDPQWFLPLFVLSLHPSDCGLHMRFVLRSLFFIKRFFCFKLLDDRLTNYLTT